MAMQRSYVIRETHAKVITAVTYNPLKHEIMAGCDDGVIKTWDFIGESLGRLTRTIREHKGWVNAFLFWSDAKLMLSAGNDGKLIAWGTSMFPLGSLKVGLPIYSMAWNSRRELLVLGMKSCLRVYPIQDPTQHGGALCNEKPYVAKEHKDIVKGVVCHETRVYSAGYDQMLCIYESYNSPGKRGLKIITSLYPAHDAGITTLVLARDKENNTWLLTGAFDKSVKVWSQDGQVLHKFDNLSECVSGLCYVSSTKTIWVAAGTPEALMYDPKSGDNVSEFIGTFQNKNDEDEADRHELKLLQYIPDLGQVIATNGRRQILIWKYNPTGCITALKNRSAVESLTYTKKAPLLIFSGDGGGNITRWEQLQSNTFMYSKEHLSHTEAVSRLATQIAEKFEWADTDKGQIQLQVASSNSLSHALLKMMFVEELDILIAASEDGNIYVWGFDYDAVRVLKEMRPKEDEELMKKFAYLLKSDHQSDLNVENVDLFENADMDGMNVQSDADSVTNRVAGFICKSVLIEHTQCVSGMAVVGKCAGFKHTYMVSGGWDRRLILWNLDTFKLVDVFRNPDKNIYSEEAEYAADGIITDLTYCQQRNEIAYTSTDKLVYIREFSVQASQMKLKAVLQGHEAEVSQIRWNPVHEKWVSGSEDCTIRIWSADGMTCDLVLLTSGSVTTFCIDSFNGCIIAGLQDTIKVYDIEVKNVVQTNVGHTDSIRCVIHLPERDQYVSASWDKTVRVWNAYKKTGKKKLLTIQSQAETYST